ncbi:MAG: hypothetical protein R3C09_06585 [Pirellulaceae bacterium]
MKIATFQESARQENLWVSHMCEVQWSGLTIRAPALPSVLANGMSD